MKDRAIYLFILLFNVFVGTQAQVSLKLELINTDHQTIFKKIIFKKEFSQKQLLEKELSKIQRSLINEGYLQASIDSLVKDSVNYKAYLLIGPKYKWLQLTYQPKDAHLIHRLGYAEHFFSRRPFKYAELAKLNEKIISYYENNGYPFATVKLDSFEIKDSEIKAQLKIEKNTFVKLDSLVMQGNAKVNHKFLTRYLGIKDGMPYKEEAFKTVSKKTKQLPFFTEKTPPVLRLTDKQNKLYLFLDKKNASQFDGIVGILPDDKGKTIFTGDVKIKLVNNILRNGETFDINWRRLQSQTQDLKANFIYPYLFGLPVGVDYAIKLYKKDTTFIDVNNGIGLNYYFSGLNHIKVFYKQRNANLISTSGLTNITVLPEYADVVTKSYGVGAFIENLDYKFNPKKGFSISWTAAVGNRQIKKNPKINDAAYNNLALKSSQYQLEGVVAGYLNLYKNHVLKLSGQFGSVFGNTIYRNELMRIGGLRTLRGFDEESIYASTYVIPTLEYRFLFEQNSNLFLFAEGAWYENNSVLGYLNDTPISMGAGINFDTKAGIFNLSYGLGKQFSNGFDLRTGKIHAGLTALF